jgi:hypothetical protein
VTTAFQELQQKLAEQWPAMGNPTDEDKTMVVVPSLTVEVPPEITPLLPAYEERFLFLLLLLAQPRARVVYVTSQPVLPRVVDYYLGLVPSLDEREARERLAFVSLGDPSPRPLTQKLLDRPRAIARVRRLIPDPDRAHLVTFNTTPLEEDLAVELGIPVYGAGAAFSTFGTKSGARRLFEQEGVPHPDGFEVSGREDVLDALDRLRVKGRAGEAMVKLNDGVGGLGNAVVSLVPSIDVSSLLASMQVEGGDVARFLEVLEAQGGVVEERIAGGEIRSPSVQFRVAPGGEVELLSTHDQVLGGPTGQAFFGSRFPADPAYAPLIAAHAEKIARRLASEGAIGRFAIDFVVVGREDGGWDVFAIEINLRKGGTTHPFLTLQFLTGGDYDGDTARFVCRTGAKHYVASDHLEGPGFQSLTPDDLLDLVEDEGLQWDPDREEGVVFHMISALPAAGRVGLTAVGTSAQRADDIYRSAEAALRTAAEATRVASRRSSRA